MKTMKMILMSAMFVAIFGVANAQYTGPGSKAKVMTVQQVSDDALKLDRKDTKVKLEGKIVEQLGDEMYWFEDSTGKIKIEIDKKYMPATEFNHETKVVIVGEVDYDLLEGTEIEVKEVQING
jgi:uncharacterized protein (TIGR00156 family)